MGSRSNATGVGSFDSYLHRRHLVATLNDLQTFGVAQFQHLVHQSRNAVGVFQYLSADVVLRAFVKLHAWRGNHLCEAREYVERGAYLVGNLLDELRLHSGSLLQPVEEQQRILIALRQIVVAALQLLVVLA